MNKKIFLSVAIFLLLLIGVIFGKIYIFDGKNSVQSNITQQTSTPPLVIRVFLDSGFLLDVRDIFNYGFNNFIFTKDGVNIRYLGYTANGRVPAVPKGAKTLDFHIAVFGTMLDEYEKDTSVKWIGTVGRGIIGYGTSRLKKEEFNTIKNIGITGSGGDINLLGNLYLAGFGIDPMGKKFIETTLDKDRYEALKSSGADLVFFKGNRVANEQKYTVIDSRPNNTYFPFRTIFVTGDVTENKEIIDKFIKAVDDVKKDILEHPDKFKQYIDKSEADFLKKVKDSYYNDLSASIHGVDTLPNQSQLKDSIGVYLKTKNMKESDLNIENIIY